VVVVQQRKLLTDVVRNWHLVRQAFDTRHKLVHGRDRVTMNMAKPHIDALLSGACDVADYCESDVLNTFRVWLRYELFRGGLSYDGFRRSEDNLMQFIAMRGNTKPHLTDLVVSD